MVRTILVLGYWVLGDISRYWIVLILGDMFLSWHPIRYWSDSSRHHHCLLSTIIVNSTS